MTRLPAGSRKGKVAAAERIARVRHTAEVRAAQLEQGRRTGLFVAIGKRFLEIDGAVFGGLMAIELFTTVLPLMILSFGYFSGFAANASIGTMFVKQLGLTGNSAQTVRAAFGSSKALHSAWTVAGMAGWLVWGIPMALTVSLMFAKAWRREPFTVPQRLWRGLVWFLLYLTQLLIRERISFDISNHGGTQVGFFLLGLIPSYLFWTVTPVILVRDGGQGWKFLAKAGLVGVLIDGVILALGLRMIFPSIVHGWTIFGPIGVAMAIMTWCGILGYGWVTIACVSGVIWERSAPIATVVAAEGRTA